MPGSPSVSGNGGKVGKFGNGNPVGPVVGPKVAVSVGVGLAVGVRPGASWKSLIGFPTNAPFMNVVQVCAGYVPPKKVGMPPAPSRDWVPSALK